jgi:hypothetical protein
MGYQSILKTKRPILDIIVDKSEYFDFVLEKSSYLDVIVDYSSVFDVELDYTVDYFETFIYVNETINTDPSICGYTIMTENSFSLLTENEECLQYEH